MKLPWLTGPRPCCLCPALDLGLVERSAVIDLPQAGATHTDAINRNPPETHLLVNEHMTAFLKIPNSSFHISGVLSSLHLRSHHVTYLILAH